MCERESLRVRVRVGVREARGREFEREGGNERESERARKSVYLTGYGVGAKLACMTTPHAVACVYVCSCLIL